MGTQLRLEADLRSAITTIAYLKTAAPLEHERDVKVHAEEVYRRLHAQVKVSNARQEVLAQRGARVLETRSDAKIAVMEHDEREGYEAKIVVLKAEHAAEIAKMQGRLDDAGSQLLLTQDDLLLAHDTVEDARRKMVKAGLQMDVPKVKSREIVDIPRLQVGETGVWVGIK